MTFDIRDSDDLYRYQDVTVTGDQSVLEGGVWKKVRYSDKAVRVDPKQQGLEYVYDFNCQAHRIYARGSDSVFADYAEVDNNEAMEEAELALLNSP